MNYGDLIKDAYWITLRNRFLWFFGFFVAGQKLGCGHYSSLLNSVFGLGETLAKPLVGLATRIATKIAAYTYAFLVNRLLGRPQGRIKYLWA
jgi:hypothetical protein